MAGTKDTWKIIGVKQKKEREDVRFQGNCDGMYYIRLYWISMQKRI